MDKEMREGLERVCGYFIDMLDEMIKRFPEYDGIEISQKGDVVKCFLFLRVDYLCCCLHLLNGKEVLKVLGGPLSVDYIRMYSTGFDVYFGEGDIDGDVFFGVVCKVEEYMKVLRETYNKSNKHGLLEFLERLEEKY